MPIAQVAERREMPVQFLEQLFSTLRRDGLLQSQRGVKGGYRLARPPEQITVLEVVQSLDGKVGQEADEAGGIWGEGVDALRDVFSSTTIADIARREADEAGARHVPHLGREASESEVSHSNAVNRRLATSVNVRIYRFTGAHWRAVAVATAPSIRSARGPGGLWPSRNGQRPTTPLRPQRAGGARLSGGNPRAGFGRRLDGLPKTRDTRDTAQ